MAWIRCGYKQYSWEGAIVRIVEKLDQSPASSLARQNQQVPKKPLYHEHFFVKRCGVQHTDVIGD
jgi:hypothetical protein